MNVYIDESGIHKSSGVSVVSFVYIDHDNQKLKEMIEQTEKFIGIKKFRWSDFGSKRGWTVRESFIRKIYPLNFTFKIVLFTNPIQFHSIFEKTLSQFLKENDIDHIIIDGKKSKTYVRRIKKILREQNVSIKKVVMKNDKSSSILRLADALAGLYRSHYEKGTTKTKILVELLNNKKTAQFRDGQNTW
ncbi:MAG: DUF3800 domain-containing protein [Candidatus Magasanikbacteria bacterium]|nr:DUF3800 domain-containing protein [Candidatus Magasanikbacteria bacterium]